MRLRKASLVALLTAALLADGAAVAATGSHSATAKAPAPSVAKSVPRPDGDDRVTPDRHGPPGRPDTVPWQSRVGLARSGPSVLASTNLAVHKVDIAIATPSGVSSARVAQWIRARDVDKLLSDVSEYWSTQSRRNIRFVRTTPIKRFATGDAATCRTTSGILREVKRGGALHYGKGWYTSNRRGPERREHLVVLYPFRAGDVPGSSRYGTTCGDGTLGLGSLPAGAGRNSPGGWSFNLFGGPSGALRDKRFTHYQYAKGVATVAHELGHNLGLLHAGVGWCTPKADGPFRSTSCGVVEGLDPLDLMGWDVAARGVSPLSGAQKLRLGVLPGSELKVITASSDQTVRIAARHRIDRLRTLVKAVDPATGEAYFVELRRMSRGLSFPFIGGLPWQAYQDYRIGYGVSVSRVAPARSNWAFPGEHLIVPMGPASDRRSVLREGDTFTSRTGRLKIAVIDSTETAATVRVSFPTR